MYNCGLLTVLCQGDFSRNGTDPAFIRLIKTRNNIKSNKTLDVTNLLYASDIPSKIIKEIKAKIKINKKDFGGCDIKLHKIEAKGFDSLDTDGAAYYLREYISKNKDKIGKEVVVMTSKKLLPAYEEANRNQVINRNSISYVDEKLEPISPGMKNYDDILKSYVHESEIIKEIIGELFKYAQQHNPRSILLHGSVGTGKTLLAEIYGKFRERALGENPEKPNSFQRFNITNMFSGQGGEGLLYGALKGFLHGTEPEIKSPMEQAGYGTVLFDEFGKINSIENQNKFNQLLEKNDRTYQKMGTNEISKAKCHFIATMKEPLDVLSEDHRRRFRILEIPELEDRKEDKVPLFKFFVDKMNQKQNPPLSISFSESVLSYVESMPFIGNADGILQMVEEIFNHRSYLNPTFYNNYPLDEVIEKAYSAASKQNSLIKTDESVQSLELEGDFLMDVADKRKKELFLHHFEKYRRDCSVNKKKEKYSEIVTAMNGDKNNVQKRNAVKRYIDDELKIKLRDHRIDSDDLRK